MIKTTSETFKVIENNRMVRGTVDIESGFAEITNAVQEKFCFYAPATAETFERWRTIVSLIREAIDHVEFTYNYEIGKQKKELNNGN